jgi:cytochrome c
MSNLLIFLFAFAAPQANIGLDIQPQLGKGSEHPPTASIPPDGAGLPSGAGSVIQGQGVYASHCASCHGPVGKMRGNALVGGVGSLDSLTPHKTVGSYWPYATTLFDYINRAMPYGNEKTLSTNEVYSVTAYVLFLNDIVTRDAVMDARTLPQVVMPNRNGFTTLEAY